MPPSSADSLQYGYGLPPPQSLYPTSGPSEPQQKCSPISYDKRTVNNIIDKVDFIDLEEQIDSSTILKSRDRSNDYEITAGHHKSFKDVYLNNHSYNDNYQSFRGHPNSSNQPTLPQPKNTLNLRDFISNWKEGEEEDGAEKKHALTRKLNAIPPTLKSINSNEVAVEPIVAEPLKHQVDNTIDNATNLPDIIIDHEKQKTACNDGAEKLYVLESIDVPIADLSKYKHLSVVNKLPDNIVQYEDEESKGKEDISAKNKGVEDSLKFIEEVESSRAKSFKNDFEQNVQYDEDVVERMQTTKVYVPETPVDASPINDEPELDSDQQRALLKKHRKQRRMIKKQSSESSENTADKEPVDPLDTAGSVGLLEMPPVSATLMTDNVRYQCVPRKLSEHSDGFNTGTDESSSDPQSHSNECIPKLKIKIIRNCNDDDTAVINKSLKHRKSKSFRNKRKLKTNKPAAVEDLRILMKPTMSTVLSSLPTHHHREHVIKSINHTSDAKTLKLICLSTINSGRFHQYFSSRNSSNSINSNKELNVSNAVLNVDEDDSLTPTKLGTQIEVACDNVDIHEDIAPKSCGHSSFLDSVIEDGSQKIIDHVVDNFEKSKSNDDNKPYKSVNSLLLHSDIPLCDTDLFPSGNQCPMTELAAHSGDSSLTDLMTNTERPFDDKSIKYLINNIVNIDCGIYDEDYDSFDVCAEIEAPQPDVDNKIDDASDLVYPHAMDLSASQNITNVKSDLEELRKDYRTSPKQFFDGSNDKIEFNDGVVNNLTPPNSYHVSENQLTPESLVIDRIENKSTYYKRIENKLFSNSNYIFDTFEQPKEISEILDSVDLTSDSELNNSSNKLNECAFVDTEKTEANSNALVDEAESGNILEAISQRPEIIVKNLVTNFDIGNIICKEHIYTEPKSYQTKEFIAEIETSIKPENMNIPKSESGNHIPDYIADVSSQKKILAINSCKVADAQVGHVDLEERLTVDSHKVSKNIDNNSTLKVSVEPKSLERSYQSLSSSTSSCSYDSDSSSSNSSSESSPRSIKSMQLQESLSDSDGSDNSNSSSDRSTDQIINKVESFETSDVSENKAVIASDISDDGPSNLHVPKKTTISPKIIANEIVVVKTLPKAVVDIKLNLPDLQTKINTPLSDAPVEHTEVAKEDEEEPIKRVDQENTVPEFKMIFHGTSDDKEEKMSNILYSNSDSSDTDDHSSMSTEMNSIEDSESSSESCSSCCDSENSHSVSTRMKDVENVSSEKSNTLLINSKQINIHQSEHFSKDFENNTVSVLCLPATEEKPDTEISCSEAISEIFRINTAEESILRTESHVIECKEYETNATSILSKPDEVKSEIVLVGSTHRTAEHQNTIISDRKCDENVHSYENTKENVAISSFLNNVIDLSEQCNLIQDNNDGFSNHSISNLKINENMLNLKRDYVSTLKTSSPSPYDSPIDDNKSQHHINSNDNTSQESNLDILFNTSKVCDNSDFDCKNTLRPCNLEKPGTPDIILDDSKHCESKVKLVVSLKQNINCVDANILKLTRLDIVSCSSSKECDQSDLNCQDTFNEENVEPIQSKLISEQQLIPSVESELESEVCLCDAEMDKETEDISSGNYSAKNCFAKDVLFPAANDIEAVVFSNPGNVDSEEGVKQIMENLSIIEIVNSPDLDKTCGNLPLNTIQVVKAAPLKAHTKEEVILLQSDISQDSDKTAKVVNEESESLTSEKSKVEPFIYTENVNLAVACEIINKFEPTSPIKNVLEFSEIEQFSDAMSRVQNVSTDNSDIIASLDADVKQQDALITILSPKKEDFIKSPIDSASDTESEDDTTITDECIHEMLENLVDFPNRKVTKMTNKFQDGVTTNVELKNIPDNQNPFSDCDCVSSDSFTSINSGSSNSTNRSFDRIKSPQTSTVDINSFDVVSFAEASSLLSSSESPEPALAIIEAYRIPEIPIALPVVNQTPKRSTDFDEMDLCSPLAEEIALAMTAVEPTAFHGDVNYNTNIKPQSPSPTIPREFVNSDVKEFDTFKCVERIHRDIADLMSNISKANVKFSRERCRKRIWEQNLKCENTCEVSINHKRLREDSERSTIINTNDCMNVSVEKLESNFIDIEFGKQFNVPEVSIVHTTNNEVTADTNGKHLTFFNISEENVNSCLNLQDSGKVLESESLIESTENLVDSCNQLNTCNDENVQKSSFADNIDTVHSDVAHLMGLSALEVADHCAHSEMTDFDSSEVSTRSLIEDLTCDNVARSPSAQRTTCSIQPLSSLCSKVIGQSSRVPKLTELCSAAIENNTYFCIVDCDDDAMWVSSSNSSPILMCYDGNDNSSDTVALTDMTSDTINKTCSSSDDVIYDLSTQSLIADLTIDHNDDIDDCDHNNYIQYEEIVPVNQFMYKLETFKKHLQSKYIQRPNYFKTHCINRILKKYLNYQRNVKNVQTKMVQNNVKLAIAKRNVNIAKRLTTRKPSITSTTSCSSASSRSSSACSSTSSGLSSASPISSSESTTSSSSISRYRSPIPPIKCDINKQYLKNIPVIKVQRLNMKREPIYPTPNSSTRGDSKRKSISDSIVPKTNDRSKTSQSTKTESRSRKEFESRSARIVTRRATAAQLELRSTKPEEIANSDIKVKVVEITPNRRSPRTTLLRRQSVLLTGSDSCISNNFSVSGTAKKRKPNFDEILLGINQYYKQTTNNNNILAINANSNSSSSTSSSSSSSSSDVSVSAHNNKGRPNITYSKDKVKRLIIPKSKIFDGAFRTETSLVMPTQIPSPYVRLERNQFIDRLGKLCALTAKQELQPYR